MIAHPRPAWLAAVVLVLAASAAGAQPARTSAPPRQCFFQRDLNGWKEVGDRQVNLRAGVRDVYQADLNAPCWNLKWAERLGVENRGSSSVCTGDLVVLIVPDHPTGTDRCFARITRKLTPEQVAALPPKQRP
jgi:hypothetical protein